MLLNFTFENWMSFRQVNAFSMIASRERRHGERVAHLPKYHVRCLPVAALYGGNASGKTNFFTALVFAQNFIVQGVRPDSIIKTKPFLLEERAEQAPCRFHFEILVDETIYEYSFAVTSKEVTEEKLVQINATSEKTLFERSKNETVFDYPNIDEDSLQLDQAAKATRDNMLFLTRAVDLNLQALRPVYDWFKKTLVLVSPIATYARPDRFVDADSPLTEAMGVLLSELDTGIENLSTEKVELDSLDESLQSVINESTRETGSVFIPTLDGDFYLVSFAHGRPLIKMIMAGHQTLEGKEVKLKISEESDGSKRIIDLLPAFLDLSQSSGQRVYVVDEIDRSLHPLLIERLLELYLDSCTTETRKQLIFTTHNVFLMNQNHFRRDEIWVTERDKSGASSLFSFNEYKDIRYDKDIRKSYLQGRLGGIPRLSLKSIGSDAGEQPAGANNG